MSVTLKAIVVVVCLGQFGPLCAIAQSVPNGWVWKKTVAREIRTGEKEPIAQKKSKGDKDITLTETLVNAIKAGKLPAYTNTDISFSTKLTIEQLNDMVETKHEKVLIVDPITGKEKNKTIERSFKYDGVLTYRILENWTFNPVTCVTEIQIAGIAPIRNVYDTYGVLLGVQAMFWLRYDDARPVVEKYEKEHPEHSIRELIWDDYFLLAKKPRNRDSIWECMASRIIEMPLENEDTVVHHLRDQALENSLFGTIIGAKSGGSVASYANYDHGFINKLGQQEFNDKELQKVDTQIIVDPVNNTEITKHFVDIYNPKDHKIKLLEDWTFNTSSGKTTIEIAGLAPLREIEAERHIFPRIRPMFWVRFNEVSALISKYYEYQPENTFGLKIWNDYFLSDVKPEVVK